VTTPTANDATPAERRAALAERFPADAPYSDARALPVLDA